jgi:hypothetical protein
MIIINADGRDYITNASLLMQSEYMLKVFRKYPMFFKCASGGLMKAMIQNPDTWSVRAVSKDLKKRYEDLGVHVWNKKYNPEDNKIWQQQAT